MPLPRLPLVGFAWSARQPFSPSTFTPIQMMSKKLKHLDSTKAPSVCHGSCYLGKTCNTCLDTFASISFSDFSFLV